MSRTAATGPRRPRLGRGFSPRLLAGETTVAHRWRAMTTEGARTTGAVSGALHKRVTGSGAKRLLGMVTAVSRRLETANGARHRLLTGSGVNLRPETRSVASPAVLRAREAAVGSRA